MIITGGWIESVYLLIKIIEKDKDPSIISRIGEQQKPLANIIELLQPYYGLKSEDFNFLFESLIDLSEVFDAIEIIYIYEAPITDVQNKTTIIKSSTTYNVFDEELNVISEKIMEIRNWVISE